MVIDDDFLTVPSFRAGTVPSVGKDLLDNTREKSADGFYDITKTWFEADIPAPHAPLSRESDIPDPLDTGPVIVGTDTTPGNAGTDGVSSTADHNPNLVAQDEP